MHATHNLMKSVFIRRYDWLFQEEFRAVGSPQHPFLFTLLSFYSTDESSMVRCERGSLCDSVLDVDLSPMRGCEVVF